METTKNCGGLCLVAVPELVAHSPHFPPPVMIHHIPLCPQEELASWKMQVLLDQLKADFPDAPEHVLEHAVHQAAALLWPGMNLVALFTSASMLVRELAK
jgi:hypothetical protein